MGAYESLPQDVSSCDERGQSPENREEMIYDFLASDNPPLGYDTSATTVFDSNLVTQSPRPKRARSERKKRAFICNECGKSFKQKGAVREHWFNIHSVERPFVCSSCNLKFKRKKTLQGHIFCVHGHQRPFRCVECGSTFKRKDHLQRHVIKIHCATEPSSDTLRRRGNVKGKPKFVKGGGGPFAGYQNVLSCNLCQSTFKRKDHFRKHVFQVHGEKELPDDVQSTGTEALMPRHRLHRKAKSSSRGREYIDERKFDTFNEDYRSQSSPEEDGEQKSENEISNDPIHQNGLAAISNDEDDSLEKAGLDHQEWKGTRELSHKTTEIDLPSVVEAEGTAFRCEVCGETFELRIKLGRHFKRKHSSSRGECRATTDSTSSSVRERDDSGGSEVTKEHRIILVKKKMNFEVRRKSIVADCKRSRQKISCPSCMESFKEYRELTQHARKCEKYALFAKEEQKKRREVVLQRREYGCSICGSTLLDVESMSAHLSEEHGTDFFFHMCKPCPCEDGTHFTICH